MDLKETYNKIAKDWRKDHMDDTWWITGAEKFVSFMKKGDLVLDVGCGAGLKAKYLTKRGLNVVGIDFSKEMIQLAKKEVPTEKFLVMDVKNIEKLTDIFDGIFAHAVLLHIPKGEASGVLRQWINKLKPQGQGYLYLAVKEIKPEEKEEMIVKEEDYGYPYERFFSYFSRREIRDYLKNLNVKILWENNPSGERPWIQIIGQKVGRNDPCPCGATKSDGRPIKYKHCHGKSV